MTWYDKHKESSMKIIANIPVLTFASQKEWQQWLAKQYQQPGVWLKFARKNSGIPTVVYAEALEVALCYGWIDGQNKSYDERYYIQKFTPRRPKSLWSKNNVKHAEALIAAKKMKPPGLAAIESAKLDGRWEAAYDPPSTIKMPPDFQAALDANPKAKQFYGTLNRANTYAFCLRVQTAKKPETRQARIEKFITMLQAGQKLY